LAWGLLHAVFAILGPLLLVALILFVIRAITQGNSGARWNAPWNMRNQWQQPSGQQQQQPPYYQPPQPYYQPSPSAGQEEPAPPYGQGYQPQQPYYRPAGQPNNVDQPQTQYPEEMPPMRQ